MLTSKPGSSIVEVDFDRPVWAYQRKLSLKTIHYSMYRIRGSRSKRVIKDKEDEEESVIAYLYCDIIGYTYHNNRKRQLLAVVNLRNVGGISTFEDSNPIFHDIIFHQVMHIECYFEDVNGNEIIFDRPTVIVLRLC